MFVAAVGGAVLVGVVVGAASDDDDDDYDYSDHSNYSEYSDASMLRQIREAESHLQSREQEKKRLKRDVQEILDEEIEALRADPELSASIPDELYGKGADKLESLSTEAANRIESRLQKEIADDERDLQQIDAILQKINAMRLNDK